MFMFFSYYIFVVFVSMYFMFLLNLYFMILFLVQKYIFCEGMFILIFWVGKFICVYINDGLYYVSIIGFDDEVLIWILVFQDWFNFDEGWFQIYIFKYCVKYGNQSWNWDLGFWKNFEIGDVFLQVSFYFRE